MSYELEPGKRKEKQYGFYLTVYFLRMAFRKMSTVSVYKEEKYLLKSGETIPSWTPNCKGLST